MVSGYLGSDVDDFLIVFIYYTLRALNVSFTSDYGYLITLTLFQLAENVN